MSNIPESSIEIESFSPDRSSYQETQSQREDNHPEGKKTRSKAIRLIRARTIVRMSPPISSPESSPVKSSTGSPERYSERPSPRKAPGKSPGSPSDGCPQKPPKRSAGKSPQKSSGKTSKRSSALNGQPVQLFQTQVPSLEPNPAPKKRNDRNKSKKKEPPSREQSPMFSNSESVYQAFGIQTGPYVSNSQSCAEQTSSSHTYSVRSHGFSIENSPMLLSYLNSSSLAQSSSNLQFGHYLVPRLQGGDNNTMSFESEVQTSPEAYDQAEALSAWGTPETTTTEQGNTAHQYPSSSNESDRTALTTSLTLPSAASLEENITSEQNEVHGTKQFRRGPGARRNSAAAKITLPPIRESSREVAVTLGHPVLEPGGSTTRDSQEDYASPDTTEPSSRTISTQSSPNARVGVLTQKPEGFFWQLDSHGFPCASAGCDQRCNLWDGSTVICPKCGPYSEVRYCSKDHLLDDVKWHWLYCGQMAFEHPCRENSIPQEVRNGIPLIPCMHNYDTPERHRQAVYFNVCAGQGDYFIFSDWTDLLEIGFMDNVTIRCPSRVIHTVTFDNPTEKDRFRRVLAACLFFTVEVVELVDYMFRIIRDNLRSKAVWTRDLEQELRYQLTQELSVKIQPHITGERHACETDWDGRSRHACPDTVCRTEFRRFLGTLGGMGHRRLVDHLEAGHWILRAARTTHPDVSQAEARMQGEGFEQLLNEDKRKFCRGTGWDGAGSGCMEIEGINA